MQKCGGPWERQYFQWGGGVDEGDVLEVDALKAIFLEPPFFLQ